MPIAFAISVDWTCIAGHFKEKCICPKTRRVRYRVTSIPVTQFCWIRKIPAKLIAELVDPVEDMGYRICVAMIALKNWISTVVYIYIVVWVESLKDVPERLGFRLASRPCARVVVGVT